MAADEKLLQKICRNKADVRLAEACKAAQVIGYEVKSIRGSHHTFKKPGELDILCFQKLKNGKIPNYQADQLIDKIKLYMEQQ